MRFQVLTAASMKMVVFWVVASCGLLEVTSIIRALMMDAAITTETSLNFYQTPRRNIPEDSHTPNLINVHVFLF
jgi:hypothetical protein